MRTTIFLVGLSLATLSQAALFDNFSAGAYDSGNLTAIGATNAWQSPSSATGSVRYVSSTITANTFNQNYRVQIVPGFGMTFVDSGVGVDGTLSLGYGYANGSTTPLSAALNLNSVTSPTFAVTFMSNDLPTNASVTLYSSTFATVVRNVVIPGNTSTQTYSFDFSGEAALADVDSVLVAFNPGPNGDFAISRIESVPEPATLAIMSIGLLGVARLRRRR